MSFSRTGELQALEIDFYSNMGYSFDLSVGVMHRTLFTADNAYRLVVVKMLVEDVEMEVVEVL